MSHIMEKTLATLPKLLTQSLVGGKGQTQSGPTPLGQEVMNFMKAVHRARSKTQESAIVGAELAALQEKLKKTDLHVSSTTTVRNAFTKIIFIHLLGYDVTSLAVNAMKLCQQGQGYHKRVGYLVTCLLLHRHHEMALLMMCTLQRDLTSHNMGENWMALQMAGEIVAEDHIQYLLPEVVKKLKHSHDLVKEKAVHCLMAFYHVAPALLQPVMPELIPLLSSRDPGVLNALMNIYVMLSEENPEQLISLGSSFLHILDQIINRGFGASFYYHMVPLPWLQISLLKILGNVASVDSQLCISLCPVLEALIERTKVTEPISLAILMESVKTATKVKADDKLLDLCSLCVGKLLSSSAVNNMRFQGLGLLIALSKVRPSFAARHQVAVVECLNDPDYAIQARTTNLLHAMANTVNVKAICQKLFEQLNSSDSVRTRDIILMVSDLAERLITDLSLYLQMYFRIFTSKHLSSAMRIDFVELVLTRIENFTKSKVPTSPEQDLSMTHLARDMMELLQNKQTTIPNLLLAVQILGCLAPALKTQSVIEDFFLSTVQMHFMPANKKLSGRKQCLLFAPLDLKTDTGFRPDDMSEFQCSCLQVMIKMVLGGCLQPESVKQWLENLDKRDLLKNSELICYYDELLNLVSHSQDIALRAEIMFKGKACSSLDLSLSFMDELIVQDMLQGKECFVPQYVLFEESSKEQANAPSLETSIVSSPTSDFTHVSTDLSLETSMIMKSSTSSQSKWRDFDDDDDGNNHDDEEEQFTVVDVDKDSSSTEQRIGHNSELFAGLDNLSLEKPNVPVGKHKSLWDDESHDNDMTINIGFNLHPFGLPRKSKSHKATWFDEDENDNPAQDDDKNLNNTEYFSSLSETCDASNSIYADFKDFFAESSGTLTHAFTPAGKVTRVSAMSSGIAASRACGQSLLGMSVSSTVDSLTDSDPAEESDSEVETASKGHKSLPP
ncbi:Ap-4 complex subunit epsilon-1-like [Plakobranchus ocellatus]|uniref:Ap-4 complex subunit epsilon-1-like n=1 Tax=Plakobranchus ocellatus TaxID=259542 RepID=A0AAV4A3M1_9GAST|nr:Ap-4 complex subunit epsilon-1-like [Plakobranchus ocellatus]